MIAKVLVAEDETKLAALVCDYLNSEGFATRHIANGDEVIAQVHTFDPDVILLDLMLPNVDGITLCREIRKFSDVPILMVTAKVDEIDRVIGLEIGADDYLCKPFSLRELVARIKVQTRRLQSTSLLQTKAKIESQQELKPTLVLDEEKMLCRLNGHDVALTAVEFSLLLLLYNSPERVYSRAQLIDNIYNDRRIVSERTMDSHIKKLRKQLALVAPNIDIIHSVYGAGYKLILP